MIGVFLSPRLGSLHALALGILVLGLAMLPIEVSEAEESESSDMESPAETIESFDCETSWNCTKTSRVDSPAETTESLDEISEASALIDRLQHKTLLLQTAKGLNQGDVILTGYDGPVWLEGRVGLTDWLELDGYFSYLYVFMLGGGAIRVHFPVGEHLDAAVGLSGGYFDGQPFQSDGEDLNLAYFGGSFELTGGFGKHLFTGSVGAHGIYEENCWGDNCFYEGPEKRVYPGSIMTVGFGYRYLVNEMWSVQTEAIAMFYTRWTPFEPVVHGIVPVLITGGGRWHMGRFFGDLGLVYPIVKGYYGEDSPGRYFPLGIPYFSVGVML